MIYSMSNLYFPHGVVKIYFSTRVMWLTEALCYLTCFVTFSDFINGASGHVTDELVVDYWLYTRTDLINETGVKREEGSCQVMHFRECKKDLKRERIKKNTSISAFISSCLDLLSVWTEDSFIYYGFIGGANTAVGETTGTKWNFKENKLVWVRLYVLFLCVLVCFSFVTPKNCNNKESWSQIYRAYDLTWVKKILFSSHKIIICLLCGNRLSFCGN